MYFYVQRIDEYSIYFETNYPENKKFFKPIPATNICFPKKIYTVYWIPKSKFALKKLIEINKRLLSKENLADYWDEQHTIECLSYFNTNQARELDKLQDELTKLEDKELDLVARSKQNSHELLYDYQKIGVERIKNNNHLLIWEMQTGKTATVCNALKDVNRAVVLIEKGHQDKWISEFKKFGGREDVIFISAKLGNDSTRNKIVEDLKYQSKWILLITTGMAVQGITMKNVPPYDHLVVDEGHYLTNTKSKRTGMILTIAEKAKYKTILTGTPTNRSPSEIIWLLKFLYGPQNFLKKYYDPYFFEEVYNHWAPKNREYGALLEDKKEEWKSFLELYSSNVLMNEDLKPKVKRIVQRLALHPEQKNLYTELRNTFAIGDLQINTVAQMILREQQLLLSPSLLNVNIDINYEAKWTWLKWYLQQNPNEKIVIFSSFSTYLNVLKERLQEAGYVVGTITGNDSASKRNKLVNNFQNGDTQILLCNTIAGGKGWTLNKADAIIFLNRDWSAINNDQAEARFNAAGAENLNKKIIDVIVKDSVEEYVMKVVNEKWTKNKVVKEFINVLKNERTNNYA